MALDEKEYTFDADMTIIGDDNGPNPLLCHGRPYSGCTDETVNVFIESAILTRSAPHTQAVH